MILNSLGLHKAAKHSCLIFPVKEPNVNRSRFRSDLVSDLLACAWMKTESLFSCRATHLNPVTLSVTPPSRAAENSTWQRRDGTLTVTCWPSPADRHLLRPRALILVWTPLKFWVRDTLWQLGAALNSDQVSSPEKTLTGKPAVARLLAPAHITLSLCD